MVDHLTVVLNEPDIRRSKRYMVTMETIPGSKYHEFWNNTILRDRTKYFLYVTGSDILSLVEVQRHQLENWSESNLINSRTGSSFLKHRIESMKRMKVLNCSFISLQL